MTDLKAISPVRLWDPRSLGVIMVAWLVLQFGGIFSPGLLDDVDSIYIQIAREMLHRHDFVTPYVDGIRFFDKPPLMYWLAAGSMRVFGETDWAARLPLAMLTLGLFVAVYALGLRLFATISPVAPPDRGALYATLALATSIGPYLYTRFFIPDILICLWMTLSVHAFLVALDRVTSPATHLARKSALLPCLLFATTLALNLLTKGLIGVIFPVGFVLIYLGVTRQLRVAARFHLLASTAVFLAIAAPWHILAALRNPPIAMPAGVGLPERAGWAWFYFYNEHVARFLGTRVPHDYGQTPVWLFWIYALLWLFPWITFLPASISAWRYSRAAACGEDSMLFVAIREASGALFLWALLVLGFFTFSSRQEYYNLPALPALALLIGGALALADGGSAAATEKAATLCEMARGRILRLHGWLLLPIATLVAVLCATLAMIAPHPAPSTDLATLLANNPELYNLSLGHLFDLRLAAMGLFRGPLATVAVGMVILGPVSFLLRRRTSTYAANLALAAGMTLVLLAAHEGLARFNPILGSKSLADAIVTEQAAHPELDDLIVLDGEYTSGSTLPFYTRQPAHLVDGRVNTLWFGSFYPDAPALFETEDSLRTLWAGPRRVFLLTYKPDARVRELKQLGSARILASAGGKSVLINRP